MKGGLVGDNEEKRLVPMITAIAWLLRPGTATLNSAVEGPRN